MPKRTNPFQALIKHVAQQLAPSGVAVRESIELEELGVPSPAKREIDVVLELDGGVTKTRIALDCRDHGRPSSIQWVDELIGKYRNLPIDKVIAVSRSGFTQTARKKAALNGIELLTLDEATEHPWPAEFVKLGVLRLKHHMEIKKISFVLDPPRKEIKSTDQVSHESSGESGTVEELLIELRSVGLRQAREFLKQRMLGTYKVVADLDKLLVMEWTVPASGLIVTTEGGTSHKIIEIVFQLHVRSERAKVAVTRSLAADKALITSAVLADPEDPAVELRLDADRRAAGGPGILR